MIANHRIFSRIKEGLQIRLRLGPHRIMIRHCQFNFFVCFITAYNFLKIVCIFSISLSIRVLPVFSQFKAIFWASLSVFIVLNWWRSSSLDISISIYLTYTYFQWRSYFAGLINLVLKLRSQIQYTNSYKLQWL